MSDQELKKLWQQPQLTAPLATPDNELVSLMKKKMRKFDRTLFWRDVRELAACVIVFIGYAINYVYHTPALMRAGCIVIMLTAVFIAGKLLHARRAQRRWLNPASMREFLHGEVDKVNRQIRLLETVAWWYLLPLFVGMMLYSLGEPGTIENKIDIVIVDVVVFVAIAWVNRYAVRKSLRPLKQQLEQTLNELPEFSDSTPPNNP